MLDHQHGQRHADIQLSMDHSCVHMRLSRILVVHLSKYLGLGMYVRIPCLTATLAGFTLDRDRCAHYFSTNSLPVPSMSLRAVALYHTTQVS
jgi:hypothetical protein